MFFTNTSQQKHRGFLGCGSHVCPHVGRSQKYIVERIRELEMFLSREPSIFCSKKEFQAVLEVSISFPCWEVIIQIPPGSTNMARSGALLLILGMIFLMGREG